MEKKITVEEVQRLFDYRPDGNLIWRYPLAQATKKGDVAGCVDSKRGLRCVHIRGKKYSVAKLVWMWHKERLPENNLLHKNSILSDNRIENLYEWGTSKPREITYDLIRELFDYHKDGHLVWKVPISRSTKKGDRVTYQNTMGYVVVFIENKPYYAHRIIWLWHHGYVPENNLDHINRNKSDNRIENLREVSQQCNMRNSKTNTRNKTGVKGISYDDSREKYVAQIRAFGKNCNLGRHSDFNEAVLTRFAAEQCLGWKGCDSSSPAYRYALKHKLIKK